MTPPPATPTSSLAASTNGALPPPVRCIGAHLGSLLLGAFAATVLHYVLYRIGLPLEPFIYVSF